ncbi:hypothetical protein D9M68_864640 [compost metagenome]
MRRGVERFDDLAHGQIGGVRGQRRDAEGGDAGAQQQHTKTTHDAAGVPGEALARGINKVCQRVE